MAQRSTRYRFHTPARGLCAYGKSYRTGLRPWRHKRSWRACGMPALVLSGLLRLGAAVLSQSVSTPEERSPVPREVYAIPIIIVQEDTLPPVMHRIAQCESGGQHFTKAGKVVRGTQHAADLGLFQINTVV